MRTCSKGTCTRRVCLSPDSDVYAPLESQTHEMCAKCARNLNTNFTFQRKRCGALPWRGLHLLARQWDFLWSLEPFSIAFTPMFLSRARVLRSACPGAPQCNSACNLIACVKFVACLCCVLATLPSALICPHTLCAWRAIVWSPRNTTPQINYTFIFDAACMG